MDVKITVPLHAPGLVAPYLTVKSACTAAYALSMGVSGKLAVNAMGQLDAALRDIEIMPTEFNLSEDERKTLTKQAAKELAELLKTSYKSIPKNGKLTPEQTIELFKVAAPLWREIAAMNWEYVQARVESTRLGAFSAVAEIISEFRANLPADDQDIDASDRYLLMRLVPTLLDENGDNRFYWSAKLLKHDIPWYQGHNAILSILQDS